MLPTQAPRPVPIDSPPPPRFIPPLIVGEKLAERHLDRRKNLPKLVLFVDNNFGNFRLRHHLEKVALLALDLSPKVCDVDCTRSCRIEVRKFQPKSSRVCLRLTQFQPFLAMVPDQKLSL
ncbi:unnamed protein product [Prunus armeniaca]